MDRGGAGRAQSGRDAGAPGGGAAPAALFWLRGLFSFGAGPAAFLRERARESALREAERAALERRHPDAEVFLRSLALGRRREEVEAAARAGRADRERLLFCVRSGAVKAPPHHWAR